MARGSKNKIVANKKTSFDNSIDNAYSKIIENRRLGIQFIKREFIKKQKNKKQCI